MKHFASMRLEVRKITKPSIVNGVPYSHRVKVVAVKNKVSAPYRVAEFDICYTKGVDTAAEVSDILVGAGEAEKKGAWIFYDGEKYQGRDAFVEAVRNPKMFDKALKKAMSLADKINLFGVTTEEGKEKDGTLSVSESED
jgi:recombination protein RecA